MSPPSPALAGRLFTTSPTWEAHMLLIKRGNVKEGRKYSRDDKKATQPHYNKTQSGDQPSNEPKDTIQYNPGIQELEIK